MICRCGRKIGKLPHCLSCGSVNVYAVRSKDEAIEIEGKTVRNRGFRCRRCGVYFNEYGDCEAPLYSESTVESLSRDAALRAITKGQGTSTFAKQRILEEALRILKPKKNDDDGGGSPPDEFDPKDLQ